MNSSSFKQGDIVIGPIPFSSQVEAKLRPALVMSSEDYNNTALDIVVLKITEKGKMHPFDIDLPAQGLATGELNKESVIQADFPVVIDQNAVTKHIGKITEKKLLEVKEKLKEFYEL